MEVIKENTDTFVLSGTRNFAGTRSGAEIFRNFALSYISPVGRKSRRAFLQWYVLPGFLISLLLLSLLNAGLPDRAFHDPVLLAVSIEEFALRWSLLLIALFWIALCGGSKRLQDRGISGLWLPVPAGLVFLLHFLSQLWPGFSTPFQIGHIPIPLTIMIFLGASFCIFFWLCLNLYFLPGSKGANKHGLDPLEIPNAHTDPDACTFTDYGRGHPSQMECERG